MCQVTDDELEGGDGRRERGGSVVDDAESLLQGESEDDELEDDIDEKAKEQVRTLYCLFQTRFRQRVRHFSRFPKLTLSCFSKTC